MSWYLSAIIAAVALAVQSLGLQRLQQTHRIPAVMACVWLGASLIIAAVMFTLPYVGLDGRQTILLLAGGIASYVGMYAYGVALQRQQNAGYVEAASGIRVVPVHAYSVMFLGSRLDVIGTIAVLGTIIATFVIGLGSRRYLQLNRGGRLSYVSSGWLVWAIASGLLFGVLIIAIRLAVSSGVSATGATVTVLATSGALFLAHCMFRGELSTILNVVRSNPGSTGSTIIVASIGNLALFGSLIGAPNAAYSVAISSSRIVLLYLIALVVAKDEYTDLRKGVAVVVMFACVVLLNRG